MRRSPTPASLFLALLALLLAGPAGAQQPVAAPRDTTTAPACVPGTTTRLYVRDVGPGQSGRILRDALSKPYCVVQGDSAVFARTFPRSASYDRTVIVLGGSAAVASRVHGDVIVVGGYLHLRPGAEIDGRAVAIGGGFTNSMLATVHGGIHEFRDNTFAPVRTGSGVALDYRELSLYRLPLVELIGVQGFQLPRYDRTDGYSQGWGPLINLQGGRIEVEPAVTWRSHLGAIDPDAIVRVHLTRRTGITVRGGRGTFTNDQWIRGDISNSLATLFGGSDARNYWRADRVEGTIGRRWEGATATFEPYVGALGERDWSTGPEVDAPHHAWSFLNRNDVDEGMKRPNPPVTKGSLASGIAGGTLRWEAQGLSLSGGVRMEAPFRAPGDRRVSQTTADVSIAFVTVRTHQLLVDAHALVTRGDSAPPQRFSYLGGAGTIPTMDLLSEGGDQLFLLDSRYVIPIERVRVPYLGSPSIAVHHLIGSAGVGRLPSFTQNIGARAGIGFLRAEYLVDPKRHKGVFSLGFSFGR